MRGGKVKSTKLEIDLIALQGTLPRVQADSLWEWEGGSAPFFWGLHVSYIDQARYWVGPQEPIVFNISTSSVHHIEANNEGAGCQVVG